MDDDDGDGLVFVRATLAGRSVRGAGVGEDDGCAAAGVSCRRFDVVGGGVATAGGGGPSAAADGAVAGLGALLKKPSKVVCFAGPGAMIQCENPVGARKARATRLVSTRRALQAHAPPPGDWL